MATSENKQYMHLSTRASCPICDWGVEGSFHVLVGCAHAQGLWDVMSDVWPIPRKEQVLDTSKDWLLLLLSSCSDIACSMIVTLVWRIWQVRVDITHGKEAAPVQVSAEFLESYMRTILDAQKFTIEEMLKGKMVGQDVWERPKHHCSSQVLQ